MIRIVLAFIVIICALLTGNWFSQKLTRRCNELQILIETIEKIKTHIYFGGYEITRVVTQSFSGAEGFDYFKNIENTDDFLHWWKEGGKSLFNTTALNQKDIEIVLRFGEGLGVTDVQGQVANCELYKKMFLDRLDKAKDAETKNSKLYKVVSVSVGCILTLVVL